jgi:predicted HAD superfamily Cof-like phosphohydrolase
LSINALHPLEDVLLGAVEKQADFYGRIIGYPIPDAPEILTEERYEFGQTFFCEEFDELYQARQAGDLEGQLDAYLDIAVVALGRVVEMGVCTRAALQEVMRANSSKKRGKNAKRGDSGFDAVKPPGWRPPDFRDLLEMTLDDVRTFSQMKRDFGEGAIYAQADEETVKVYPPDHLFTEDLSLPHTSAERYRELQVGGETRAGAYSPARPSMAANGFMKFDGGKVETPELIPAPFLRELATLYAKGAAKYAAENWRRG